MNKIGMHIHVLSAEAYEAVGRLQPALVTVMDPKAEWIEKLRSGSPGTTIVGRRYEEQAGFWQEVDPGEYARRCYDMVAPQLPDGWVSANEPFGHDDHHLFEAFDRWQAAFVVALRELGIEGVSNCFGTGNFTGGEDRIKITEAFPRTCKVARVYGPHDYDWPHMNKSVGWRCLRWIAWLEDLRAAGYDEEIRVAVTEAGLTQATYGGPDVGWQTLHDNLMVAADLYLDSLRWYNEELVGIPECIGCATFDWAGSSYGWESFEHLIPYIVDGIAEISAEGPKNGGNGMKIYDFDHGPGDPETVDWDWVRDTFGDVQVRAIEDKEGLTLQEGHVVYKLDYLDARVGDANIIINVRDEDGHPVQGETVMFGWPDAPAHGYAGKPSNWTENGVPGDTNDKGDVGPGLGTGAYYSPADGERGPHFVWVWDLPSDYVDGLGMIAGTNHAHLNLGYRAVKVSAEDNGGGDGDGQPGEILKRLDRIIEDAEWIRERLGEVDELAEELADAI